MTSHTALRLLLTALILASILIPAASAAGTISIDTAGLIGKTTDTILVPVKLTTDTPVAAYQFNINAGDTDTATIAFYRDSVIETGATSGEQTVYWYTTNSADYITGEQTLLYLAVTPKVEGEIDLTLSRCYVYDSQRTEQNTTLAGAKLTVSGIGTGNTIGDAHSGATMINGPVSAADGSFTTGDTTGVIKVVLSETRTGYIGIYYGSMGAYPAPEGIGYFDLYDITSDAPAGEPVTITFAIAESDLTSTGKTADDLFVLHNIRGQWYKTVVTQPQLADGVYTFSAQTWAGATTFLTGYDMAGKTFQQETQDIVTGKSTGSEIPVLPIVLGAVILIIALAVVAIAVKRRKN